MWWHKVLLVQNTIICGIDAKISNFLHKKVIPLKRVVVLNFVMNQITFKRFGKKYEICGYKKTLFDFFGKTLAFQMKDYHCKNVLVKVLCSLLIYPSTRQIIQHFLVERLNIYSHLSLFKHIITFIFPNDIRHYLVFVFIVSLFLL